MIALDRISKAFWHRGVPKYVARDVSVVIPSGARVGLMGRNGAGKSTLLSIIAGSIKPDAGRVRVRGTISWPIGLQGCIHPDLTGAQNVKFIARVYGVDSEELTDFVAEFAELGSNFNQLVRFYSSGMRARLNFGMSMGIRFDTYLIDEVSAVGDASFRRKSRAIIEDRLSRAGLILVTHSETMMRQMCTIGAVLEEGRLSFFDDVDAAVDCHARNSLGEDYQRSKEFMED